MSLFLRHVSRLCEVAPPLYLIRLMLFNLAALCIAVLPFLSDLSDLCAVLSFLPALGEDGSNFVGGVDVLYTPLLFLCEASD